MEVLTRIDRVHRLLTPMLERGLITQAQATDCERGILNLSTSFKEEVGRGTHHHEVYTHEILVMSIFNWCSKEAQAFAMDLNLESVAYDTDPDGDQPAEHGGAA